MGKKVLFNKNQLKTISESLEKQELSNHLRPFIFKQVKKHMTSLGDNDAFPPEEDLPFDYKILKDRFETVIQSISKIEGLESYDETYLSNELSKCVKECKEVEEAIRPNLEKICINVILKLFDVPNDALDFEAKLVDEVKPEHQFRIKPEPSAKRKFDFDSLDDFKNANKLVLKRRMVNALIQGASYMYSTMTDLYFGEIYKIDKRLLDLYEKITAINDYLLFTKEEDITDEHPMQAGCVEVTLSDTFREKSTIKAQGIIFPFLLHELIKGFMELFASHGLPEDDAKARYIIGQADFIVAEPWDLRMGVGLWNYIGKEMKDTKILPYFFDNLCCLPTKEFNKTLQEIFAKTAKGKHLLKHMFHNAEEDMIQQNFLSKISLQNSQLSVISDDVTTFGEINEAMHVDADKSVFDYPNGKLYTLDDATDINDLLSPIMGDYIGIGSARIVYEIDDYQVMKIAYGSDDDSEAGILQNRLERSVLTDKRHQKYSIFPKFLYGSPDNKWIIVEKVIPAEKSDFILVFGMEFDSKNEASYEDDLLPMIDYFTQDVVDNFNDDNLSFVEFISWCYNKGSKREFRPWERKYLEAIKGNVLLKQLFHLVSSHRLMLGDLIRMDSWGMVMRDGKPVIVLLDAGLNKDIFRQCYMNENVETEAKYKLNPDEKGDKTFSYQVDYDWKGQDERDEKLSKLLGLDDKKDLNTQISMTNKSNSLFNNAKDKMPFKKELANRLRDRFGKDVLSTDDLNDVDFDVNALRSIDKNKNSEETKVMKAVQNEFDITAIGQSFSHGNAKLSADILVVNLTTATNCPSAKKGLCAIADICYAKKDERQYKNTIMNNLRNEIFIPMLSTDEFIKYIDEYIENCLYKTNYIRFNESGDFPNQEMVMRCEKAAEYFYKKYGIISSAYTCRSDLDFTSCEYLIINASNVKVKGLDRVYLAVPLDKFNDLPDNGDIVIKHGKDQIFKCVCNCRRCHFCYKTRGENGEVEGTPTKVYCMYHKDAQDEKKRLKKEMDKLKNKK